jgi:hypothetical protein
MLVAIKKCEFFTRKIDFIGFIIKLGYISIDLKILSTTISITLLDLIASSDLFPTLII